MTVGKMPHTFKVGDIVLYRPTDRMRSAARGTYTITALMPALDGQQPEYRIKHFNEDFERVALEIELSPGMHTPASETRRVLAEFMGE